MSERRFADAASHYSKAIEYEPDNAANYFKLFRVHSRMRNFVSALKDITKACEVDPAEKEYRLQKAKLLVSLGLCDEAVMEYNILSDGTNEDKDEKLDQAKAQAQSCADQLAEATEAYAKKGMVYCYSILYACLVIYGTST